MIAKNNDNLCTDLLKAALVGVSALGATGFFLGYETLFMVCSILCVLMVFWLSGLAVVTIPKAMWPMLLLYVIIFSLELVIGCLCTESVEIGLLLGACFIGLSIVVLSRLIDWSHEFLMRHGPEWVDDSYDVKEHGKDEMKPILLDETLPAEERIASMSRAFGRMDILFSDLRNTVEAIRHNRETVKALERYMESGLWQQDCEAVKRGDVSPKCDQSGVLSEDGLHNLLEFSKDVLKRQG